MTTESNATTSSQGQAPSKSLLARAVGVIFSPRETYADVARAPRWLGAMLLVIVLIGATTFAFLSTEVGQNAMIDQQLTTMESFGMTPSEQMISNMEQGASRGRYFAVVSQVVFIPLVTVIQAGLLLGIFNAFLGGDATFRQVFAISTFSSILPAIQTLFIMPLNYVRESMSSATSLSIFLPMIDANSFAGMLLGSIDLFRIWWLVSLAIGLGVLYKRRTSPIAWSLLGVYGVLVLVIAGIRAALSGA
jgi:hypothetical protein